jgi:cell wall-associated NlpC family hydrolase
MTQIKKTYTVLTMILTMMSSYTFPFPANQINSDTSGQIAQSLVRTYSQQNIEELSPIHFKYAIALDTTAESIFNATLYYWLDEWMGIQYLYGGNSKEGIDCSSFSGMLYKDLYGLELPRTSQEQYNISYPVYTDDLTEGDLLFFKTGKRSISHVGVYLGNGRFAHASTQKGVTIDHLEFPYYKKRFVGGGRINRRNNL